MIDKLEKKDCMGCNLCGDICPVKAISYQIDEEGFWYPLIDYTKCIKCNLCEKKCPSIRKINYEKEHPKVFSAYNKDDNIRLNSTSGGVFFSLAKTIVDEGGYVVGAIYSEDYKSVKHICSNKLDDIKKMMGSKYFQSTLEGVYTSISQLLKENKKVLFCGTPCQISAVQSMYENNANLITVDFVCRGINSPYAFKKHAEELEKKYKSKIKFLQFKNKKTGWRSLATYIEFENGKKYHADRDHGMWIRGYVEGNLFMRDSCYNCKFKKIPRNSDISFGDFWGIKQPTKKDLYYGVSMVLINSKKGKILFNKASKFLEIKEQNFEDIKKGNPCLLFSAQKTEGRKVFFKNLKKMTFSKAVKKSIKESPKIKMKRRLKIIYKKIRRIIFNDKTY